MSKPRIENLASDELARVFGAFGTGAKTELQAVGNYEANNGTGNWFQKAGSWLGKAKNRAAYSAGITSKYDSYRDTMTGNPAAVPPVSAVPGGQDYVSDMGRLMGHPQ
jgi:hypothetical protein